MKTQFNLTVAAPCSEKFENFTKTASGGFCESCSREVIDFTSMSEKEISKFFQKRKERTCGRFNATQLKAYNKPLFVEHRKSYGFLSALGLSMIALLLSNPSIAQEKKPAIEVLSSSMYLKNNSLKKESKKAKTIKGVVSDKIGPLPGASVLLKGTLIGTDTDIEGKFTFPKPLLPGDILVFSYLGYESIEVKIKNIMPLLKINMVEGDIAILGAVGVEKLHKSKRSLWDRIKSIF